jgi:hypothetical protein
LLFCLGSVFLEHPLRSILTEEVHARPFAALKPPEQASHLAFVSDEDKVAADFAHLVRLCQHYDVALPAPGLRHFTCDFGPFGASEKGYSRNRIAMELNKRKVPTPRRGKWDHSSVRNVMQRLAA